MIAVLDLLNRVSYQRSCCKRKRCMQKDAPRWEGGLG